MANNYFQFKQFTISHELCAMKVGTDGVLLGAWIDVGNAASLLDVGCGTGLISLMAAQRNGELAVTALDIDEGAVEQTKRNVELSPWPDNISVIHSDFTLFKSEKLYDIIVSNPPFFKEDIKSPDHSRSMARSSGSLNYDSLISKSSSLLSQSGRLSLIMPSEYYEDIISSGIRNNLFLKRAVRIHPLPGRPAKRVMVEFTKQSWQDAEYSDLVIEISRHSYSDDYIALTRDFYLKM